MFVSSQLLWLESIQCLFKQRHFGGTVERASSDVKRPGFQSRLQKLLANISICHSERKGNLKQLLSRWRDKKSLYQKTMTGCFFFKRGGIKKGMKGFLEIYRHYHSNQVLGDETDKLQDGCRKHERKLRIVGRQVQQFNLK